ncbi:protein kinase [Streptomyces sp. ME02-8801-2C]|uniref:protein kinase domain-containing protein n=1 Tax=Streptomyces sp. ME02-8801-2C TaxID=3028680 RepID=UPI0029AA9E96|nr:protein kinase [Streptomyces sp. ME02-8801-2C]MDX3456478.1 protein kinase [Streptomyces sp. ME02-8801-2C]
MVKAHVSTHELVAGRYRLLDVVHRETNRVSWAGEDTASERPVVLTQIQLPPDPREQTARRTIARVMRASEILGLVLPGRVGVVIDVLEEFGTLWTVAEWIDGTPLSELLERQGTFNYVRAARIALEVLDVLEGAHREGIVHAELSPGQVFVRDQGPVVVTGFGLAGATSVSRVGAPSYASPEQAHGARAEPSDDLWALGALLYAMAEGRPPFRDRGRPDATLRAVDRLPLRSPVRAGPLTQVIQGLLRKNARERLTAPVARDALLRVIRDEPDTSDAAVPTVRLRGAAAGEGAGRLGGGTWNRRATRKLVLAGTALAVVTVAVLATTDNLPGIDASASGADTTPSAVAPPDPVPSLPSADQNTPVPEETVRPSVSPSAPAPPPPSVPPSAKPTPTPPAGGGTAEALPAGFRVYQAPEGFSVALPQGWKRLSEDVSPGNVAYRIVFGAAGDPRTLTVTYSQRLRSDPVAVWRDDVEPVLSRAGIGFQRIGAIRATTFRGHRGADMEWLSDFDGTRIRTLGRGFLIGENTGFSLRWTTPAADWESTANKQALDAFFRTFRE